MKNGPQEENIGLLDLIDLNFLQEFQDAFANAANVASIMVDDVGPITKPSNFTDFCIKYTRGSELGYKRCNECDIAFGKSAAQNGEPVVYCCHSGLTDFAVPIMLNGKHIASILGGQILTDEPDEKHFKRIANELGIDEDEYIEALKKIKIVPEEQVKAAVKLLSITANSISEIAHKNFELIKKNKKETVLRKVIEITRSSLDIKEVKQNIVNELGKVFMADRCYLRFYDKIQDEFDTPEVEYLSSPKIKSLMNVEPDQEALKVFSEELKRRTRGFYPVVANKEFVKGTPLEDYMKSSDIIADYAMPIIDNEEGFTWLVLHYSHEDPKLDDEYKNLLETIAFHVDTALSQIKLHDLAQIAVKKETLLRQINEIIRDSQDIDSALAFICEKVSKMFNVQRVLITQFIKEATDLNYIVKTEYKTDRDISSLDIFDKDYETAKYCTSLFTTIDDYLAYNSIQESDAPGFFKNSYRNIGVKSALFSTIKKGKEKWGNLLLFDYNQKRVWTKSEKDFLNIIANQICISVQQAELYSKMQQQIEREKAILSNLPFMVWLKDKDNKILAANEPFAKMCGDTIDNIIGKTDYDFWPEELAKNYIKDDMDVMQNGKTKSIEELVTGPNGSRWHETFKTPLFNEKGEVVGTTGFARDITERKEIDKMKNEFVSMVSHELRTPLTSIRGALGLVLSGKIGYLPEKANGLLDIANNNCLRLINLINDILDIEKIEAGKMDFKLNTIDIIPLVNQAVQLNVQYAQKFNVTLDLEDKVKYALVNIDTDRLMQVLTNLLSNAIKFSSTEIPVKIVIERLKGFIRVSVTNYGTEIPKEFQSRIFQKFAQADSSDSRQKGGTGLGLNISKAIIEKLNGNIGFISKDNKTTFYFEIPEIMADKVDAVLS